MKQLSRFLFPIALILACLTIAVDAAEPVGARVQLPSTVVPVRYELVVKPDIDKLTFEGWVRIDVEVLTPTNEIVLNAVDLDLDRVVLDGRSAEAPRIMLNPDLQTATFSFPASIAPGRHHVAIDYRGKIYESPQGLFALTYNDAGKRERMLATQFEVSEARRFLPSWDEPARKATFALSVIAPKNWNAVSNMPVTVVEDLADGAKRTDFQETPAMSSYLLFLGIGDVERLETDVDGTKVGVVARRGEVEKARFALDSAADLLRYYNDYFGVRYPLPKVDIFAVPGTGGFWGMENWGAILCFEYVLLVDPRLSTESDRQIIFAVVAHEMAHQWFGNLVTMKWWDDLWLNEGFASWMESKATEHFHPEWRTWLHSESARQTAMQQDARKTTHPIVQPILSADQAAQAFDFITYNKGQAIIRMLEGYVGEDAFREGVRAYMWKYAYDNTETADFWSELETAAAGKPIRNVARDFTEQAGVPLISLEDKTCSDDGRTHLTLTQGRFGVDEASQAPLTWHTPVTAVIPGTASTPADLLVTGPDATPLTLSPCAPVKINAGQTAYFRSTYSQPAFDDLIDHFGMLAAADQLGLLYDALALGEAGAAPITNFLQLTHGLALDADPVVWNQLASMLEKVDNLYADVPDRRGAFRAYARAILAPVLSRLGWESRPGEANNITILRETLIDKLGRFDDPAVIEEAQWRFRDFLRDRSSLPAAIRRPTLQVVARKADISTYETFHDLARKAESPLEKQQLYQALASGEDPALAAQSLKIAVGDEVPASTGLSMIRRVAADNPDLAWRLALDHLDALGPKLGPTERYGFVPSLAANSTNPDRLSELRDYIDRNIPSGARQNAERSYLELAFKLKVRASMLPEIDRWLTAWEPR